MRMHASCVLETCSSRKSLQGRFGATHELRPRCCRCTIKAHLNTYGPAGWFSLNVPSGLTLYWFTNNLLSTGQQLYLKQQAPPLPDSLTSSNTGSSNRVRAEDLEPPKQGELATSSGNAQVTTLSSRLGLPALMSELLNTRSQTCGLDQAMPDRTPPGSLRPSTWQALYQPHAVWWHGWAGGIISHQQQACRITAMQVCPDWGLLLYSAVQEDSKHHFNRLGAWRQVPPDEG